MVRSKAQPEQDAPPLPDRRLRRDVVGSSVDDLPVGFTIEDVVLVGGTTMIPCVRRELTSCFPNAKIHRAAWASLAVTTGLVAQTCEHATIGTGVPVIANPTPSSLTSARTAAGD